MASNQHGFDFLNAEHTLNDDGQQHDNYDSSQQRTAPPVFDTTDMEAIASAHSKPDLEKQFDILAFLKKHRGALAPSLIYHCTGIDLESDVKVAEILQKNPKVKKEFIPDPENASLQVVHYAYQPKYPDIQDRNSLLAQINKMHNGVPVRDLEDSYYAGIENDIETLITAGDVIAVQNTDDKVKILFPRGKAFYVELDGLLSVPDSPQKAAGAANPSEVSSAATTQSPMPKEKKSPKMGSRKRKFEPHRNGHNPEDNGQIYGVDTDVDPREQIQRGEAICVGGQWFRVSSDIHQPTRAQAQAPLSVVSRANTSKRSKASDRYVRPFEAKHVPLDHALSDSAQQNIRAARQAREKLPKLGHGRRVTGQLTGSSAHASNPTKLEAPLATAPNYLNQRPPTRAANLFGPSNPRPQQQHHLSAALSKTAELEKAAADAALAQYSHARRHGCTLDVRSLYLDTRSAVPESDDDLQQLLVQHKLLEPNEPMRKPRLAKTGSDVDNDGKKRKRRNHERKKQRLVTNKHLEGTEIGALLMRWLADNQAGI